MNGKKFSKKTTVKKNKQKYDKTVNKTAHSCNLRRISLFRCMKETVVAAVFMFELILFQIFGPKNDMPFCPLIFLQSGIFYAICDLVL